jgi:hypothetical protein
MTQRKPTKREVTSGIGRYLDAIEDGTVNGKRIVRLGALKGFPNRTDDPDVIARAIELINEQAQEGTSIERLQRTQRALTLARELDALVNAEDADDVQAFFVEHALAWATERGVGYGAFRAMGVPADVLRDAGITRGFEP